MEQNQSDKEEKSFWKNMRRDSGELRFLLGLIFAIPASLSIIFGFYLVLRGVYGEFKIITELSGTKLYLASVSPGIAFAIIGLLILLWALPKTFKNL